MHTTLLEEVVSIATFTLYIEQYAAPGEATYAPAFAPQYAAPGEATYGGGLT